MSLRQYGKKIGKFKTSTVLGTYDLDIRLCVSDNQFWILVPKVPGGKVEEHTPYSDYEPFHASTLEEVKTAVEKELRARDTTDFVDVIEYHYMGSDPHHSWSSHDDAIGFDFRVARVSTAKDKRGQPKLEIEIDIDDAGKIAVHEFFEEQSTPEQHHYGFTKSMPFSVSRWQQCCKIRDGLGALAKALAELLGENGEAAAKNLDTLGNRAPLLLVQAPTKKE